jgi:glycosyltransferase involved in cell wall biosynthesis
MAYNEDVGLPITVGETHAVLSAFDYEILIVDDGSSDGTAAAALALSQEDPRVRVITHSPNRGLGGVYRTGLSEARGQWITFLPADGELPAHNLVGFLAAREGHDLLLGIIPNRDVAWLALVLTWLEKLLYRLLFGYLPPFQGLFMVRRTALESVRLRSSGRGWAVLMELFLKLVRAGRPWRNVETVLRGRLAGESKVRNLRTISANLVEVLRLRLLL